MKPHPKNIGRYVRVSWPGTAEHGQVGQITRAMQDNYEVAIGCVLLTLAPESLTPVSVRMSWVDDRERL